MIFSNLTCLFSLSAKKKTDDQSYVGEEAVKQKIWKNWAKGEQVFHSRSRSCSMKILNEIMKAGSKDILDQCREETLVFLCYTGKFLQFAKNPVIESDDDGVVIVHFH